MFSKRIKTKLTKAFDYYATSDTLAEPINGLLNQDFKNLKYGVVSSRMLELFMAVVCDKGSISYIPPNVYTRFIDGGSSAVYSWSHNASFESKRMTICPILEDRRWCLIILNHDQECIEYAHFLESINPERHTLSFLCLVVNASPQPFELRERLLSYGTVYHNSGSIQIKNSGLQACLSIMLMSGLLNPDSSDDMKLEIIGVLSHYFPEDALRKFAIRWCTCEDTNYAEQMLKCSHNSCPVGWYHRKCVPSWTEESYWICLACQPLYENTS